MHQRRVEPPEVDLVANHEYEEEAAAAEEDPRHWNVSGEIVNLSRLLK